MQPTHATWQVRTLCRPQADLEPGPGLDVDAANNRLPLHLHRKAVAEPPSSLYQHGCCAVHQHMLEHMHIKRQGCTPVLDPADASLQVAWPTCMSQASMGVQLLSLLCMPCMRIHSQACTNVCNLLQVCPMSSICFLQHLYLFDMPKKLNKGHGMRCRPNCQAATHLSLPVLASIGRFVCVSSLLLKVQIPHDTWFQSWSGSQ